MPTIIRRFLPLVVGLQLGLLAAAAQTNLTTRESLGRVTNGPALLEAFRLTTTNIRTQLLRLPPHLATNSAFATNTVRILLRTNFYSYTNLVFQEFLPDTLPYLVWTNFIAHTNGRVLQVWSQRIHPDGWPKLAPMITWNTNSLLSVLGGLLSEGRDVSVPAETPLAVELDRAVSLRGRGRLRGDDANTIYTAAERVKEGQQALARLGYYRGAINGALDDATRRALFQFQVDKGLNGTGNLDGRTAQALGVNLSGGLSGSALSADAASALRRDAQSLVSRARAEIGATTAGRLDATRTYAQGDLELWFALSAFEDNASNYEAIVRSGGNADAAIFAGRALVNAARRVDSAVQGTRVSAELQNGWTNLRRQIATLDTVR